MFRREVRNRLKPEVGSYLDPCPWNLAELQNRVPNIGEVFVLYWCSFLEGGSFIQGDRKKTA